MSSFYFDYNATTPLEPSVLQAMMPYLQQDFGNPSSGYELGQRAATALKNARKKIARCLGCHDSEIVFTSGATESNNTAIRSALATTRKKKIITSSIEHSSVRKLCVQLRREGYEVQEISVNASGELDIDELLGVLDSKVALVSLMYANNETGIYFPIEKIGVKIKERGILFHVDGVQLIGKEKICLDQSSIDFFSLSAHKFYGPKGIGALYIRKGVEFQPLICGGSQERGRRAGTENLAGAVGLGAACELAYDQNDIWQSHLKKMKSIFESELKKQIPEVAITGESQLRLINTSHVRFAGISAEALLMSLDQKGIYASSGSACMSGAHDPSHVLKAMGFSDEEANQCVRFSFGKETTADSIYILISELRDCVSRLRVSNQSFQILA